ncbi:MAG TPA: hypothetical protein EYP78_04145 [Candidatus Omnitrophica bacterium]|nr:hypothetical protein [Candidatus Omnitrophota bacterium]
MEIKLFGKESCGKCGSTKNKIAHLLKKWNLEGKVQFSYFDMDTLEGLTEGAYHGITETPTTVIISPDRREIARFDGKIPHSSKLKELLRE